MGEEYTDENESGFFGFLGALGGNSSTDTGGGEGENPGQGWTDDEPDEGGESGEG